LVPIRLSSFVQPLGSIDTLLIEGISGLELKSAIDEDMKIAIEPASMLVPLDLQLNNPPM
jgi:hypothetical protein